VAPLSGMGISVDTPEGWDARIYRREAAALARARANGVLHAANFALPMERGDFGSGAVEAMGADDVLVTLVDHGPESAGTPLFAREGMPSILDLDAFSPNRLQRPLPGQAGAQFFFTSNGRGYCLYVVLGSLANRGRLVPQVNEVLGRIQIEP
jgi:hypothetical protein